MFLTALVSQSVKEHAMPGYISGRDASCEIYLCCILSCATDFSRCLCQQEPCSFTVLQYDNSGF